MYLYIYIESIYEIYHITSTHASISVRRPPPPPPPLGRPQTCQFVPHFRFFNIQFPFRPQTCEFMAHGVEKQYFPFRLTPRNFCPHPHEKLITFFFFYVCQIHIKTYHPIRKSPAHCVCVCARVWFPAPHPTPTTSPPR